MNLKAKVIPLMTRPQRPEADVPDLNTLSHWVGSFRGKQTLMFVLCSFFLMNVGLSKKNWRNTSIFLVFFCGATFGLHEREEPSAAWPNPSYVPERYCLYCQVRPPGVIPPARAVLPRALPWQQ